MKNNNQINKNRYTIYFPNFLFVVTTSLWTMAKAWVSDERELATILNLNKKDLKAYEEVLVDFFDDREPDEDDEKYNQESEG